MCVIWFTFVRLERCNAWDLTSLLKADERSHVGCFDAVPTTYIDDKQLAAFDADVSTDVSTDVSGPHTDGAAHADADVRAPHASGAAYADADVNADDVRSWLRSCVTRVLFA